MGASSWPDKPPKGTGLHRTWVLDRIREFAGDDPAPVREAFLAYEKDKPHPHVTNRDLQPYTWGQLKQALKAPPVDISDLEWDENAKTAGDVVPYYATKRAKRQGRSPMWGQSTPKARRASNWKGVFEKLSGPDNTPVEGYRETPTRRASTEDVQATRARAVPTRAADISDLDWNQSEEDTKQDTLQRYVITWAQNATPIHDDFFASLLVYCEHMRAELVVIPGRYRNPTSVWTRHQDDQEWWDERLESYFYRGRRLLAADLIMFGDVSIQPTAVRPLTGWEATAGQGSAVFGHPKVQLKTVPSAHRGEARTFVSTGAITFPNYTDTKAGKKAAQHHVQGAAVVEVYGSTWFLRQINAESDGSFIDLTHHYSPAGVEVAPPPHALVLGDVHAASVDEDVLHATLLDDASIAKTLRPRHIVYHDVLDFRARNHHDREDPNKMFERAMGYTIDSVEDEVKSCIDLIDRCTPEDVTALVVPSNHDEAFDRWLREAEPKRDPRNAVFYHRLRLEVLERYKATGEWTPALEIAYEWFGQGRAKFLRRDDPYVVEGVALGFHGDLGANGGRGSVLSYSKLGAKTITGHGHSPEILEGAYRVGLTGELDQGYNRGPSSWAHAHCVLYANGKRSLIFVKGGAWRLEEGGGDGPVVCGGGTE